MNPDIRELYHALGDLAGTFHRPHPGTGRLHEAGVSLDRALFVLLVRIERRGPIGIGELAELAGRDYTTVSRQVTKLESLGLVSRRTGVVDRRVRQVVLTSAGLAVTTEADRDREIRLATILATWSPGEIQDLARLTRKFDNAIAAVALNEQPGALELPG